jgi:hypothetical protein
LDLQGKTDTGAEYTFGETYLAEVEYDTDTGGYAVKEVVTNIIKNFNG